jgi:putative transcriptional regulator
MAAMTVARALPSFVLAFCLLAAMGLPAGLAEPQGGERVSKSLAGLLLVATPDLPDPHFAKSVIFVARHNEQGAFGIVVNKVLGRGPAGEILREFGVEEPDAVGDLSVHFGGPVGPYAAFVLHSTDYKDERTQVITPDLALTSDKQILSLIGQGKGPRQSLVAVGYAGWGPGQLENEIAHGSWYIAPPDVSILFSDDPDSEWSRAVKIGGLDL